MPSRNDTQDNLSEPNAVQAESHCYLAVPKVKGKKSFSTDSARKMGLFMWGKDCKEWTLYKAVRITSADASSIEVISAALESR